MDSTSRIADHRRIGHIFVQFLSVGGTLCSHLCHCQYMLDCMLCIPCRESHRQPFGNCYHHKLELLWDTRRRRVGLHNIGTLWAHLWDPDKTDKPLSANTQDCIFSHVQVRISSHKFGSRYILEEYGTQKSALLFPFPSTCPL